MYVSREHEALDPTWQGKNCHALKAFSHNTSWYIKPYKYRRCTIPPPKKKESKNPSKWLHDLCHIEVNDPQSARFMWPFLFLPALWSLTRPYLFHHFDIFPLWGPGRVARPF